MIDESICVLCAKTHMHKYEKYVLKYMLIYFVARCDSLATVT